MQPDPHQALTQIIDYCFEEGRINRYTKGAFLGKGGFARCYQLYGEGQPMAVKIVEKKTLIKQRSKLKLVSEIKIHKSLSHPNVVRFIHDFEDNANVYILLQLCQNKSLNELLKRKRRLSQAQIRYYVVQVMQGIEYLHSQSIVHRDLKLGNLLLNQEMQVKIGDLGLACRLSFSGEKRKTICGTPNYIAPEILESLGHSFEADIWSLGIIIYTMHYGRPPFESKDVKDTYKKIKTATLPFPDTPQISPALKSVLAACLQKEPSKRVTINCLRGYDFFRGPCLSRQPSLCFKNFKEKEEGEEGLLVERSDNGRIFTNNQMINSKDTNRQISQDRFVFTQRKNNLSKNQRTQKSGSQKALQENTSKERFFHHSSALEVKKWIDYSSKYGIGYLLNNGHLGVYFNDSTKIISPNPNSFYYIQKVDKGDLTTLHSFHQYPSALKKKISLYKHFKGYLLETENQQILKSNHKHDQDIVYVKRWFRSKHAVIFRLSNKTVQVIFIDQSQLLINAETKQLTYLNKNKQKQKYGISDIINSQNRQLIKRFEYTKQVLNQMTTFQQNKKK